MLGPLLGSIWNQKKQRELRTSSRKLRSLPDMRVGRAAIRVSASFTEREFHEQFDANPFATGWTVSDALAAWYALGFFCFYFATTMSRQFGDDELDALVALGHKQLLYQWKMNDTVQSKYLQFLKDNKDAIIAAHNQINDKEKLNLFLLLFVERILGGKPSFGDESLFESLLRGNLIYCQDPALAKGIQQLFLVTDEKARLELIEA